MAAGSRNSKKRSLADLDKARRVGRTYYDVVVGEGDLAGLSSALEKAEAVLNGARLVQLDDDGDGSKKAAMVAAAQALYDEALAALEAHRDRIWFRGLGRVEYERLRLAHPMPEEPKGKDEPRERWSFLPALVAACAVDFDATPEEWAETLDGWPAADADQLIDAVTRANTQPAALITGKG